MCHAHTAPPFLPVVPSFSKHHCPRKRPLFAHPLFPLLLFSFSALSLFATKHTFASSITPLDTKYAPSKHLVPSIPDRPLRCPSPVSSLFSLSLPRLLFPPLGPHLTTSSLISCLPYGCRIGYFGPVPFPCNAADSYASHTSDLLSSLLASSNNRSAFLMVLRQSRLFSAFSSTSALQTYRHSVLLFAFSCLRFSSSVSTRNRRFGFFSFDTRLSHSPTSLFSFSTRQAQQLTKHHSTTFSLSVTSSLTCSSPR